MALFGAPAQSLSDLNWQPWSAKPFAEAKERGKLILLDLGAVWCHWCHVMEETTYKDVIVTGLLNKHFVLIHTDQDADPELSARYGDWGWPATILYAPDGSEIAKLRGYKNPEDMANILNAFIKDPTPGPSVEDAPAIVPSAAMFLSPEHRQALLGNYRETYDKANGGWGDVHKFIHTDGMDYALSRAEGGDREAAAMARQTLDRALALIDPEWGGIYQYSDKADWSSPHYEKIMWYQAQALRQYAKAYGLFGDPKYRKAADDMLRYLTGPLMSPEGGFYVSQDADLDKNTDGKAYYKLNAAERLQLGTPPVDKNIYARENGWAISALAAYADVTGDATTLARAISATEWIIAHRPLPGGGFSHGDKDRAGPYLSDTLAMGQAQLALYASTGERRWLVAAIDAGYFVAAQFKDEIGFVSAKADPQDGNPLLEPVRDIDEHIQVARFYNLLQRYSGQEKFRELAGHAMRYLASEQIVTTRRFMIGVALADEELAVEPTHITIVGHRDDPQAQTLHRAARAFPTLYKRTDWWDTREGPMLNPDVQYPEMDEAAAFACSNQICSRPAFSAAELATYVRQMNALRVVKRE